MPPSVIYSLYYLLLNFLVIFDHSSYFKNKNYYIFYYNLFYHQIKLEHNLQFYIFKLIF
jgi:hypothetical protein